MCVCVRAKERRGASGLKEMFPVYCTGGPQGCLGASLRCVGCVDLKKQAH